MMLIQHFHIFRRVPWHNNDVNTLLYLCIDMFTALLWRWYISVLICWRVQGIIVTLIHHWTYLLTCSQHYNDVNTLLYLPVEVFCGIIMTLIHHLITVLILPFAISFKKCKAKTKKSIFLWSPERQHSYLSLHRRRASDKQQWLLLLTFQVNYTCLPSQSW